MSQVKNDVKPDGIAVEAIWVKRVLENQANLNAKDKIEKNNYKKS